MDMTDEELRELAVKRLKEKREFWQHLVAYVVVNAALIGIWALGGGGYFWPGWVLFGWGSGSCSTPGTRSSRARSPKRTSSARPGECATNAERARAASV